MKPLPYLPPERKILYVDPANEYMQRAKQVAEEDSLDKQHPTGAVLVKDGAILSVGANGSKFHERFGCVRKLVKAPTGKLYGLCGGCSPENHAEQKAIRAASKEGHELAGADLYLWGHWWCCGSCWAAMIKAEVRHVYLPKEAWKSFGKR